MRVCMLAYAFYESDMRILRYATSLVERGDTVDVIALRREGTPAFEVLQGVNVYRVQFRKRDEQGWPAYLYRMTRFLFISAFLLAKRQITNPYDIIHVHSVPDFLVFAAIIPKVLGAHIVLDIHDILPEFFASKFGASQDNLLKFKLLIFAERLSVRFSDHVIVANDLWQERLIRRSARAGQCTAIINYPDPKIFRQSTDNGGAGDKFIVMYPGTLNEHQGLDIAIHAMAQIRQDAPDVEFHIYGEGSAKDSLIALTQELAARTYRIVSRLSAV